MSDQSNVKSLHGDCVACLSLDVPGETAALVVLRMIAIDGCDARDMFRDLCFRHRRNIDEKL